MTVQYPRRTNRSTWIIGAIVAALIVVLGAVALATHDWSDHPDGPTCAVLSPETAKEMGCP
jgi:hypothetical protein